MGWLALAVVVVTASAVVLLFVDTVPELQVFSDSHTRRSTPIYWAVTPAHITQTLPSALVTYAHQS